MIQALIEINCYLILIGLLYYGIKDYLSVQWRRTILLSIPMMALVIFGVKSINQISNGNISIPSIQLNMISVGEDVLTSIESPKLFFSLTNLYWLGVIILISLTIYKVIKAFSYFKGASYSKELKVYVNSTDHHQSFTFFNKVHLSNSLDQKDSEIVLEHELLHIKYQHTWDLILMEFYHALLWFNPVMLLLKKELVYVHEYQVDQDMYLKYNKDYLAHLLASVMGVNSSQLLLTSQFYNGLSLTQRTKNMKTKIKNNWKLIAVIPAFAVGLSFISFTSKSTIIPKVAVLTQDTVYEYGDVAPEFTGGEKAMIQFIVENIRYPEKEKKDGIEGTVHCGFVVNKKGKIVDVKIMKAVNDALEKEVMRVVDMMPNWIPGEKDGKIVSVRYVMPVKFKLPG
jgi:TonB family protein